MPKKTKKAEKSDVKKTIKKAVSKIEASAEEAGEELGKELGKVTHYFEKIGVAVIELAEDLASGSGIRIKGSLTDFKQKAESMQLEHKKIDKAKKGQAVGLKVSQQVREHDKVYAVK